MSILSKACAKELLFCLVQASTRCCSSHNMNIRSNIMLAYQANQERDLFPSTCVRVFHLGCSYAPRTPVQRFGVGERGWFYCTRLERKDWQEGGGQDVSIGTVKSVPQLPSGSCFVHSVFVPLISTTQGKEKLCCSCVQGWAKECYQSLESSSFRNWILHWRLPTSQHNRQPRLWCNTIVRNYEA